jgi:hypothetical protein
MDAPRAAGRIWRQYARGASTGTVHPVCVVQPYLVSLLPAAGFHSQNDLSIEEWLDLGAMKRELETPKVPDGQ